MVTQYIVGNGKYTTMKYPFKPSDVGDDGMGYVTIKVNANGVKEIWFSKNGVNMGYDYHNGLRWAFYELSQIK